MCGDEWFDLILFGDLFDDSPIQKLHCSNDQLKLVIGESREDALHSVSPGKTDSLDQLLARCLAPNANNATIEGILVSSNQTVFGETINEAGDCRLTDSQCLRELTHGWLSLQIDE